MISTEKTTAQEFAHVIDFSKYNLGPGDELEYFFVVTDNDALNGYKSKTSSKHVYAVPELDELEDLIVGQIRRSERKYKIMP